LATAKANYSRYRKIQYSFVYWGITICANTFQYTSTINTGSRNYSTPHPYYLTAIGSVWALPISLAATYGISLISFPRPTQMLHFGRFALPSVSMGVIERPHSEILGSTVACTYPRLIAACHVLHHLSSRVILQPASLHQHSY
jgi:hypothetical protein